jgi:hypothetical protein
MVTEELGYVDREELGTKSLQKNLGTQWLQVEQNDCRRIC